MIPAHLDYLAASGCRPRTIDSRRYLLRAVEKFAGVPILDVTRAQLISFLGRPQMCPSTKQHVRSALSRFYTWAQDEGFRLDNPAIRLPKVRVIRQEPHPIKTDDIHALLNSGIYAPTRAKVALYALQGLRACEIAALRGEHIDLDRGLIHIVDGKGGKTVWRPLHPTIAALARDYPRAGYWFPSPKLEGQHLTARNVSFVISNAMKRAGIPHTAHDLRAWFATELLESGVDTSVVQAAMRHENADTLKFYARPSVERVRTAMDSLPVIELPAKSGRRAAA